MPDLPDTPVLDMLDRFVRSRPGFDPHNYTDQASLRADMRTAERDRRDCLAIINGAFRYGFAAELDAALAVALTDPMSRLTLKDGALDYTTGQYYPTEYRRAAFDALARALRSLPARREGAALYFGRAVARRLTAR